MCVKDVAKLLSYLQERVTLVAAFVEFRQSIAHNAPHQPSRMGHQRGEMFGITCGGHLPSRRAEHLDKT